MAFQDFESFMAGVSPPQTFEEFMREQSPLAQAPAEPSRWEKARERAKQLEGKWGYMSFESPVGPGILQGEKPDLGSMGEGLVKGAVNFIPDMVKLAGQMVQPLVDPGKPFREQAMAEAAQEKAKGMGLPGPEQPETQSPIKNALGLASWWPSMMAQFIKDPVGTTNRDPFGVLVLATGGQGKEIKKWVDRKKAKSLSPADIKAAFNESGARETAPPELAGAFDYLDKAEPPGTVYGPGGEVLGQVVPSSKRAVPRPEGPTPMPETAEFARPDLADMRIAEAPQKAPIPEIPLRQGPIPPQTPSGGYPPTGNKIEATVYRGGKIATERTMGTDPGHYGEGIYFSESPETAGVYAKKSGSAITQATIRLENPFVIDWSSHDGAMRTRDLAKFTGTELSGYGMATQPGKFTARLKELGYDGVVVRRANEPAEYVVFNKDSIAPQPLPPTGKTDAEVARGVAEDKIRWDREHAGVRKYGSLETFMEIPIEETKASADIGVAEAKQAFAARTRKPGPGEVRGLGVEFVNDQGQPISRAEAFARKPRPTTEPVQTEPGKMPVPPMAPPSNEPLTPSKMVLEVLNAEKKLRRKQKALYKGERSERFAAALKIGAENPTVEGFRQQLAALKGELPKVNRGAPLEAFPEEVTNGLIKEIDAKIPGIESVRAKGALLKLFEEGTPLQPSETALLVRAFGPEFISGVIKADPKWKRVALDALGLPRAIMSSADLSFGLRQGVMMAASHPKIFSKAFAKQFEFFVSERAHKAAMDAISKDELYPLAIKSKLSLTELGKELGKREEPYQTTLGDKIPFVKWSSRAYSGMANKLRFDTFKYLVKRAEDLGLDIEGNPKLARDIASTVNVATGRGYLGAKLEPVAVTLNQVFFSPRLLASRLQALNPAYYFKLEPFARKQALRNMFATLGAGATVVGLAKLSGAEVGVDPRSADFGKIKVGNTRIDIWGGFAQYAKLAGQLVSGKLVSSTSGKVSTLGEGFKPLTRLDILQRFAESKQAPIFSFAMGLLRGQNQIGESFKAGPEVVKRFVPMVIQDAIELYNEDPGLVPLDLLGVFGVGLQTYGPRKKDTGWQTGW